MSTIPCPHCRMLIFEDAERCPHCEQYITEEDAPPRKPLWLVILAALLLLVLFWSALR